MIFYAVAISLSYEAPGFPVIVCNPNSKPLFRKQSFRNNKQTLPDIYWLSLLFCSKPKVQNNPAKATNCSINFLQHSIVRDYGETLKSAQNYGSDSDIGFRAIFVPFLIKNRLFSQVFVPHILIFKKLHLLLLSKMEVQAENGAKNH